ncbi:MAG: acetate/propionate family kinase [Trueperaceae bacterium]
MNGVPVLVVNAGSSSLKVKLVPQGHAVLIERIGGETSAHASFGTLHPPRLERHDDAFAFVLNALQDAPGATLPAVVGHRVVHGGTRYREPVVIDADVERAIEELCVLAPLHNPANLAAVRAARRALPGVPHVAVFDTAFHARLPRHAYLYGLPLAFARDHGVRRYGFHGTSHDYVSRRAAHLLGVPRHERKIVTLHLGNGASAAAVAHGVSVDTSMGFTPMEGLLMGTRSGDLDPGVVLHLLRGGRDVDEVDTILNRDSGLRGMSRVSNDMRDVRAAADAGNDDAAAALELFAYRIRKTIGAYAAAMGGIDTVVFTGGIGENDPRARADAVAGLRFLGIAIDAGRNEAAVGVEAIVSPLGSAVSVLVVPTDEEGAIAEAARSAAGVAPPELRAAGQDTAGDATSGGEAR